MSKIISFTLDGRSVTANENETIWQVCQRLEQGLPHLCYSPEPGYRADGNCRACMVEIEGERVLAASCSRKPSEGMIVHSQSERAKKAREMVFELLLSDQAERKASPDRDAPFWSWAEAMNTTTSRYPARKQTKPQQQDIILNADHASCGGQEALDLTHPAIAVNMQACIQCGLCVRACREVQVNDVIGIAHRGGEAKIVFDFDDDMGASTCVGCGECVQACPTGALMEKSLLDSDHQRQHSPEKTVRSGCPYCGVGCQIDYQVKEDQIIAAQGANGPANEQRLCVK